LFEELLMMDGVGPADRNGTAVLPLGEPHGDPDVEAAGQPAEVEAVSEGGPEKLATLSPGRNRLAEPAGGDKAVDADAEEIGKALGHLLLPGESYELRAVRGPGDALCKVFTADQRAEMVSQAAVWSQAGMKGVYFTLNPVRPDARPAAGVKDEHIAKRALLLVDCDPQKAVEGDANAADPEKQLAYDKAVEVRNYLRGEGWPEPVLADSGNGYHLLYRIDLPNDDASTVLLHNTLRALAARFDTDAVKIDPRNRNASRITKLYGTVARKGEATPDRPWRKTQVLAAPDTLEVVPRGLLEQ
jgi:hypothetical protein